MHLYATLVGKRKFDFELFGIVDVLSDTAQKHDDDSYRRDIVGTVRERGPIWSDYLGMFQGAASNPVVQGIIPAHMRSGVDNDGRKWATVNGLQVDRDFYGGNSWLNVEADTIRIMVFEHFDGTLDDYFKNLAERNQRMQARIDRALSGEFTKNDYREVFGLGSRDPRWNDLVSAGAIQEMMQSPEWGKYTRNTVV